MKSCKYSMQQEITVHNKKFYLAPHMGYIFQGNFNYLPIQCLLSQYFLVKDNNAFYVSVIDPNTADTFEIYEMDLNNQEGEELVVENEIRGSQYTEFLRQKILKENYAIYIE